LALQRALCGVRGARAQHTARGLLQLGEACAPSVGDALRFGPGAAGGVTLVGEVLWVLADVLTKLLELCL
jgi:hypothetical protein